MPQPPPPAPVLSSTLYLHDQRTRHHTPAIETVFATGVKSLDRDLPRVFCPGRIVGVCGAGDANSRGAALSYRLVVECLLSLRLLEASGVECSAGTGTGRDGSGVGLEQSVFVVEPATTMQRESALMGIYDLLSTRVQCSSDERGQRDEDADSERDVDALIDYTSILPYFDLIGLSQAVTEIADMLSSKTPALDTTETHNFSSGRKSIVFIRGLGQAVHALISRTSLAQAASLLSEILRQLRRLVKNRNVLVLVEMYAGEVSTVEGRRVREEGLVRLTFSSGEGREMKLMLRVQDATDEGGDGGKRRDSGTSSVVIGLIEAALDVMVVVHRRFGIVDRAGEVRGSEHGKCIVEVVKDRAGSASGMWTVWDGGT